MNYYFSGSPSPKIFACGFSFFGDVYIYIYQIDPKLRLALFTLLRLEPDSLGVLAPVCSSMGFLASSVTRRNCMLPLGDTSKMSVSEGNLLACRWLGSLYISRCNFDFIIYIYISLVAIHMVEPQAKQMAMTQTSLRTIILCWVLVALGHCFILEQPTGSHFKSFPHWRYFYKYICRVAHLVFI